MKIPRFLRTGGSFCQGARLESSAMEFASLDAAPEASHIKRTLAEMILWNERTAPRSVQKTIGPSEIGNVCDRRLAYRISGTTAINVWSDPWPAIVGTAIHAWLDRAVNRYQTQHHTSDWLTEVAVQPDPLVKGHSDVFHVPTGTVVDYKTTNADTLRKLRRGEDPSDTYKAQINLYGLGHERAGRAVRNVALVYYPRSGWLDDAYVWHAPYDRGIAERALARLYQIGFRLLDLDIENHPERFADVPAKPGDGCVWCPMFNRDKDPTTLASVDGCPGR
jgi:hypothetical protein